MLCTKRKSGRVDIRLAASATERAVRGERASSLNTRACGAEEGMRPAKASTCSFYDACRIFVFFYFARSNSRRPFILARSAVSLSVGTVQRASAIELRVASVSPLSLAWKQKMCTKLLKFDNNTTNAHGKKTMPGTLVEEEWETGAVVVSDALPDALLKDLERDVNLVIDAFDGGYEPPARPGSLTSGALREIHHSLQIVTDSFSSPVLRPR